MTVENDIVNLLNTTGYLTYHLVLPESPTLPAMVLQRISTIPDRTHNGNSIEKARFQVTVWAKKFDECRTLALSIKNKMDLNQSNFELATKENEIDIVENETKLFSTILDFYVWY